MRVATVGVLITLAGIIGLIRPGWLRLGSRKAALAVLIAGLVVVTVAGARSGSTEPAPGSASSSTEQPAPSDSAASQRPQPDLAQQVLATIGTAKDEDDSGAVSAKLEGEGHVLLGYHFFPVGVSELDREIGVLLTPKLKTAFEKHPELQRLTVHLYLPYQDAYGNRSWELAMRFVFDRDLYGKINWDNFVRQDLLKVVKDLERLK
ncbi:MAG TPA: hypothetical protein VIK99_03585 [Thermaerobacter sp.]